LAYIQQNPTKYPNVTIRYSTLGNFFDFVLFSRWLISFCFLSKTKKKQDEYFEAVSKYNITWPERGPVDFFPYRDNEYDFWTGNFET